MSSCVRSRGALDRGVGGDDAACRVERVRHRDGHCRDAVDECERDRVLRDVSVVKLEPEVRHAVLTDPAFEARGSRPCVRFGGQHVEVPRRVGGVVGDAGNRGREKRLDLRLRELPQVRAPVDDPWHGFGELEKETDTGAAEMNKTGAGSGESHGSFVV